MNRIICESLLLIILTSLTFSAFSMVRDVETIYVGNPNRINTIWVPGHCVHGVWEDGYYLHFLQNIGPEDLIWIMGQYDTCGNWVPGHWYFEGAYVPNRYRVIEHP